MIFSIGKSTGISFPLGAPIPPSARPVISKIFALHLLRGRMSGGGKAWQDVHTCRATASPLGAAGAASAARIGVEAGMATTKAEAAAPTERRTRKARFIRAPSRVRPAHIAWTIAEVRVRVLQLHLQGPPAGSGRARIETQEVAVAEIVEHAEEGAAETLPHSERVRPPVALTTSWRRSDATPTA